jgi:hypothetical protein
MAAFSALVAMQANKQAKNTQKTLNKRFDQMLMKMAMPPLN